MKRDIAYWVIKFLIFLFMRRDVQGMETLPETGGFILAPNHLSALDPALLYIYSKRKDITGMVGHTHRKNPIFRFIVNAVHGIWLNREDVDPQAIRAALDWLKKGGGLGIAPEGTRSRSGVLLKAKTGVAYLADKAGVPVYPAAIWGTETAVVDLGRLRRPFVHVRVGKPLYFPPVDRRTRDAMLQCNTEELMCQIAALLPEQYHGAYADHPRLKELLAGKL